MAEGTLDDRVRAAAIAWLDARRRRGLDVVRHDELAAFEFEGHRLPLIDPQRGIRKPQILEAALSLRTTYTPPRALPPYEDQEGPDGLLRYKYRGEDPQHPDNVALRRAMQLAEPLIWFVGVAPGVYEAIYPVWLIDEEPAQLQFVVALDEAQRFMPRLGPVDEDRRRYAERLTKLRLHHQSSARGYCRRTDRPAPCAGSSTPSCSTQRTSSPTPIRTASRWFRMG